VLTALQTPASARKAVSDRPTAGSENSGVRAAAAKQPAVPIKKTPAYASCSAATV